VSDETGPGEPRGITMMCPNCRGDGLVQSPALGVFEGTAQTTLALRRCGQCRDSTVPGWLPTALPLD